MLFWERQREARRSTRWLLLVFGLCVLAVVASVHLGLVLAWWLLEQTIAPIQLVGAALVVGAVLWLGLRKR